MKTIVLLLIFSGFQDNGLEYVTTVQISGYESVKTCEFDLMRVKRSLPENVVVEFDDCVEKIQ